MPISHIFVNVRYFTWWLFQEVSPRRRQKHDSILLQLNIFTRCLSISHILCVFSGEKNNVKNSQKWGCPYFHVGPKKDQWTSYCKGEYFGTRLHFKTQCIVEIEPAVNNYALIQENENLRILERVTPAPFTHIHHTFQWKIFLNKTHQKLYFC